MVAQENSRSTTALPSRMRIIRVRCWQTPEESIDEFYLVTRLLFARVQKLLREEKNNEAIILLRQQGGKPIEPDMTLAVTEF